VEAADVQLIGGAQVPCGGRRGGRVCARSTIMRSCRPPVSLPGPSAHPSAAS